MLLLPLLPIKIKSYHNNLKTFICQVAVDTAKHWPIIDYMKMLTPMMEVKVSDSCGAYLAYALSLVSDVYFTMIENIKI